MNSKKSIQISNEVHAALRRIQAELQLCSGEFMSLGKVLGKLLEHFNAETTLSIENQKIEKIEKIQSDQKVRNDISESEPADEYSKILSEADCSLDWSAFSDWRRNALRRFVTVTKDLDRSDDLEVDLNAMWRKANPSTDDKDAAARKNAERMMRA